jgi:hypothetical protein
MDLQPAVDIGGAMQQLWQPLDGVSMVWIS